MIDYIQKRKSDLKSRANEYRESVMQEYSGISRGSSSPFPGVGMIGGGLILAVFLVLKYIKTDDDKPGLSGHLAEEDPSVKNKLDGDSGRRDEFREKLVMVGLEILRQVLLTVVSKLTPLDEKTGV